ncbi:PAS domain-containing protein [Spirillospora sp. NPDC048911]|uniref:PAS domain-containing protein n=1 Tax=Spirillospora sp. NPDC048911 TaxID=3364527 RepID=UPI00371FF9BA
MKATPLLPRLISGWCRCHLFEPIKARIGRRGAALLVFAFIDLVYGLSMISSSPDIRGVAIYKFAATMMPLAAWGILWTAIGMCCLVSAFLRRDSAGFAAAIGIKVGWALLALIGWGTGEVPRGYVSVSIWAVFAGLVGVIASWPEPLPQRIRDRDITSEEAVISADADGCIVSWNAAAAHMFGWSATEAAGQPLTILIPPELRDQHRAGFRRAVATGASDLSGRMLQLTGLHRNGHTFGVDLTLSIWRNAAGEVSFTGLLRNRG